MTGIIEEDRRLRQAAWIIVATLAIFFTASMLLYAAFIGSRFSSVNQEVKSFRLPWSFAFSTLLLLGVSASLHYAVKAAKKSLTDRVLRRIWIAMILACLFVLIQSESIYRLVMESRSVVDRTFNLHAQVFALAFIHGVHVLVGVISLAVVLVRARRYRYDHERNEGLKFCTLYWHFLDVVWICMMMCFITTIAILQRI